MHAEVHRPSAAVEMSYVQFLLFYLIMRLQIMGRRFADLEKILKADETSEAWIVDYNNVVWNSGELASKRIYVCPLFGVQIPQS